CSFALFKKLSVTLKLAARHIHNSLFTYSSCPRFDAEHITLGRSPMDLSALSSSETGSVPISLNRSSVLSHRGDKAQTGGGLRVKARSKPVGNTLCYSGGQVVRLSFSLPYKYLKNSPD
ncbi:unnamed protein product, partial [Allacma fusca]